MRFLEKDLEDIISENLESKEGRIKLSKRGLYVPHEITRLYRQPNIGRYGIADIVFFEKPFYLPNKHGGTTRNRYVEELKIWIIELKKDVINVSTFLQSVRYAKGILHFMDLRGLNYDPEIKIVLIGSELEMNSSLCFLPEILDGQKLDLSFYTYRYELEGLKFDYKIDFEIPNAF